MTEWEQVFGSGKATATTPAWDANLQQDMVQEAELFVQNVFRTGGTYKDLLTAGYTFVNPRLAQFYGVTYPGTGTDFVKVDLPHLAGLLTQPAILAGLAHPDQTAPVKRGLMIRKHVLCYDPPPPPMGLKINIPAPTPGMTTREIFTQHRAEEPCKTCHVYLDPLGLPFEHFDQFGRYRETDNGMPVDATGGFTLVASKGNSKDPAAAPINGAQDLGEQLSALPEARQCLVQSWYRYAVGHQEEAVDSCNLHAVLDRFDTSGQKLDDLLVGIATSDAFRYRVDAAQ
jgi:hypothetical protein